VARPRNELPDRPAAHRHIRPIEPLPFLAEDEDPAGSGGGPTDEQIHLRRALDEILRSAVRLTASTAGTGRRVYYRANDARHHLLPDAFVKHGVPDRPFDVWRSWERGAPDIAFELLTGDSREALGEKVDRYHELGVGELVVFDRTAPRGHRLRVWDRIDGDFVERVVEAEQTPCFALECDLAVGPILIAGVRYDACVRLAHRERRARGGDDESSFFPTEEEAEAMAAEAETARELEQQASLSEAQSQRAAALARGNAHAAEVESSNDRRLATLKRPK
jgi:hypothetical protein